MSYSGHPIKKAEWVTALCQFPSLREVYGVFFLEPHGIESLEENHQRIIWIVTLLPHLRFFGYAEGSSQPDTVKITHLDNGQIRWQRYNYTSPILNLETLDPQI